MSGLGTLALGTAAVQVGFSLLAAIAAYALYQVFYGARHIGAGVHRTFLVGGPAITILFLCIQTSVPLSVGLLGTLSFVRFRTPVKDPMEIGFLLLLIACSIGAATANYLAVTVLLLVVAGVLLVQSWMQNRGSLIERGHLMISMDQESFAALDVQLTSFLKERLHDTHLETMSSTDGRVGLHYQYRRRQDFDWPGFTRELTALAGSAQVELFVN